MPDSKLPPRASAINDQQSEVDRINAAIARHPSFNDWKRDFDRLLSIEEDLRIQKIVDQARIWARSKGSSVQDIGIKTLAYWGRKL